MTLGSDKRENMASQFSGQIRMPEYNLFQKAQESVDRVAFTQCGHAISKVMAGAPSVNVTEKSGTVHMK